MKSLGLGGMKRCDGSICDLRPTLANYNLAVQDWRRAKYVYNYIYIISIYNIHINLFWLYKSLKSSKIYVHLCSLFQPFPYCCWPKPKHQTWKSCLWEHLATSKAGQPNSRMRRSAVVALVLGTRRACTYRWASWATYLSRYTLQLGTKLKQRNYCHLKILLGTTV